jgi:hypothetical protein
MKKIKGNSSKKRIKRKENSLQKRPKQNHNQQNKQRKKQNLRKSHNLSLKYPKSNLKIFLSSYSQAFTNNSILLNLYLTNLKNVNKMIKRVILKLCC